MKRHSSKVIVVLMIVTGALAHAADHGSPALSAAEQAAIGRQIATLKSSTDRQVAQDWSNAKKIAEFLCRPAALTVLKKQASGVDKVFLGTDAPDSLTLESNQRLSGRGQFRTPQGWRDITFTCALNAETGKVTDFQTVLLPQQP